MELQQLTEQMLLAVTSLNRSCIPQSVQEPLKGENFLLDYLSAQNGCSTPGALRAFLRYWLSNTAASTPIQPTTCMLGRTFVGVSAV